MKADRTTIIPAEPGWSVLDPITGTGTDDVVGFYREPVIAWRVELAEYREPRAGEFFTMVDPVTVEDCGEAEILKRPDGKIVIRGAADFDFTESVIEYLNETKTSR